MAGYDVSFGICYHLYQRGDHRQALFRGDEDYLLFLDLFRKYLRPVVDLYAYCLLPTHVHLLFRVKEKRKIEYVYPEAGMLSWQISTLLEVYARSVDQDSRSGSLFASGDAKRIPAGRDLVCSLIAYIHRNPQLHGVVSDFRYWPYSSCFAYLRQDRRSLIAKDVLLDPDYQQEIKRLQESGSLREGNWSEKYRREQGLC